MAETFKLVGGGNRKLADELADVRERLKVLKIREEEIRQEFLFGDVDRDGDEFRVTLAEVKSERVNTDKMKRELGTKFMKPFMEVRVTTHVKVKAK